MITPAAGRATGPAKCRPDEPGPAGCVVFVSRGGRISIPTDVSGELPAVRGRRGDPEGVLDPPPGGFLLPVDALGVHLEQDVDAVPGPRGHLRGGDAGVQPVGTAAWRRSYGRRASGERCWAGVSAACRARRQTDA